MAPHNSLPQKAATGLGNPSPSLYVKNLPDKLQKQDLRISLYTLFSTYGPVLDVVALKTSNMRGQAHVVFRDLQASTQALRALQGFDFFGKDMRIQYAKNRSHVFTKLVGTYYQPTPPENLVASTALQQSIFSAPPIASQAAPAASTAVLNTATTMVNGNTSESEGPQGVKRGRNDESDDEDAPMEEGDSDAPMEASSDDED